MGVKTGAGGMNIMERDIRTEQGSAGAAASKLASAKSGGAGIGGLLGAVVGQILIPIPGVGAAIGGALGGLAGSKVGGAMSGVDQSDILGGKFFKKSRTNIATDIAKSEFTDSMKAGLKGAMGALNPASFQSTAVSGFKSGAEGLSGLAAVGGGIKGIGTSLINKAATTPMVDDVLSENPTMDITNIVQNISPVGGADGGGENLLSRAMSAGGDFIKKAMPGGEPLFGGGKQAILEAFNPEDTEWVKEFQSKFMGMGPNDEGYGTFGPKTTEMFRSMNQ